VSNAPSKPVSFSRPKVGYFSNRPRILQHLSLMQVIKIRETMRLLRSSRGELLLGLTQRRIPEDLNLTWFVHIPKLRPKVCVIDELRKCQKTLVVCAANASFSSESDWNDMGSARWV